MADKKITVEFNECMAEAIAFDAARDGYESTKEYIEARILQRIFETFEQFEWACPSKAKH